MRGAYGSPLRPRSGHDLYERSSSRSCARLGGPAAGGIQFELSKRTDRIALELWVFLAGSEPLGPITANSCAIVVCGLEGDSWQLLKINLKQRTRAVRRRWRADRSRKPLALIPGVG